MNKEIEGKKRKSSCLLHRTLSILSVIMLLGQIFTSLMTTVSALEEIVEETGSLVVESSPPTASEPVIEIVSEEPETTPPIEPTQTSDTAETNVEPEQELSIEEDTPPSNEQSDSESESSHLEETASSNELSTDLPQEESQDETPHVNSPISLTTMSSGITVTLTGPGTSFPEHHNDITLAVTTITDGRYQTAVSQLDALLPPLEQASRQTTILGLGLYQNGQAIQLQGAVTITFSGLSYQQAMHIHQVDGNGQLSSSGMSLSGQTATLTTSALSSYSFTALNQPTIKIESEEASSETETESEETADEVDDVQESEDNTSNNESVIESDINDETLDTSDQLNEDSLIEPQMILPPETRAITYEFYVNDAKIDEQIILNGERVVEPASPTTERNFLGWYTDVAGVETLLDFATPIVVTEDSPADIVRVDAKFENVYYVDFMQNGVVIATKEVQAGNQTDATGVPVVEDIEEGMAFSHWSTEPNGAAFDFAQAINQDVTLYAVNSARYKVTFDTVGGTQILPVYVQANSPINFASITPIKAGYSLNGWLLNGNSFNTDTPVSQNMTLTANWQAINQEYTVIYWHENANDTGYSFKEAVTRTGITGSNATHQAKTYPGFTFDSVEQNVVIEGDGSTQLNVYYSRDTFTLTFRRRNNNNNWVNVITPVQVKHGASILTHWNSATSEVDSSRRWRDATTTYFQIEPPIMPMRDLTLNSETLGNRDGYVIFVEILANGGFIPMKTVTTRVQSDGSTAFVGVREIIGFTWQYVTRPGEARENLTSNNDYTVSTYYTRNQYDIQFVTNNHTGAATIDVNDIYYEASIANVAPASYVVGITSILIDGITYVFDGWYDNQVLAGSPFNFAGKTMPANNLVYYAKWVPKNFTVVNHYGDGVTQKNITITPNGTVQDKADELEKMDKAEEFAGWYWFVDGRYVPFDLNMPIKRDGIEIYPEWIGDVVNIEYDANGGENPPTDTRDYQLGVNAYARAIATMQRAGYRFIGWNTKSDGSGEAFQPYQKFLLTNELVGPDSVLTLYAQWSKIDTTQLTYDSNYPDAKPEIVRTISNIQMNSLVSILAPEAGFLGITHTDYEFVGWNTARDGSGTSYQPTNSIRLNNPSTENILYAQWIKKINITVNKIWNDGDNQDGKRPLTLAVQLYANNQAQGSVVSLTPANNWTYTWTGLPEKSGNQNITYSVKEVTVPAGYQAVISPIVNGVINIKNSYTPEVTKVEGTKTWNDNNNQDGVRPTTIKVNLLADGVQVDQKDVSGQGNVWSYSFDNLPAYKAGVRINYTVTEETIEGYSLTSPAGNVNLVNSRTPDERSITVTKSWDDANDQDGKRPNSIQFQLLADNSPVGSPITVTGAEQWTHTWTGLPVNNAGQSIDYTVEEVSVPTGYESSINDKNLSNILVTNVYVPETTSVVGTKTWDDNENQDGVRPTSLKVYLFANGIELTNQVITGDGNVWNYSFDNLPVYRAGSKIVYTVTEETVDGYSLTSPAGNPNLVNEYTPEERSVTVTKSWLDNFDQDGKRPLSIEVQLLANGQPHGDAQVITSADNWTFTWTNLPLKAAGEIITYTVAELNVADGYASSVDNTDANSIKITNSRQPELLAIQGTKTWEDASDQDGLRPVSLKVYLLANGTQVAEQTINGEGNVWDYSFNGYPKYANGQEIVYTVTEETVLGYSLTSPEGSSNLVNEHTPEERSVTVTKNWQDNFNQDGKRPLSIEVQLLADGEAIGAVVSLNPAVDWTYTWTELPLKAAGEFIEYSVEEVTISNGYTSTINDYDVNNIIITNSRETEKTSINGTKTWDDANDQDGLRPEELTIYLLADGLQVDSKTITGEGNTWNYSFTDLPAYKGGQLIVYTVTEDQVPGYSLVSQADSFDLINKRTPDLRSVTVTKAWLDNANQDGKRPLSIEVQLLADGEEVGSPITLTPAGDWSYTWTNLPVNAAGEAIDYSVKELTLSNGYISTLNDSNDNNIIITNTRQPEVISISGTKTWNDGDDQDGVRPTELRVYLLANGFEMTSQVISGEGNVWNYSFDNLPAYREGERIIYTVTEETVEGYTMTSTNNNQSLINTRTPDERAVTVTKSWLDNFDQDGKRPLSIDVQLLANGEAVGTPITLTPASNWTYTWTGLPLNAEGEVIDYSVSELTVGNGYTSVIDSSNANSILITNTRQPETTQISGAKIWDDAADQDGVRPTELRIYLLANGFEMTSQVISGEGDTWEYSFTDLPAYRAGERIVYTVSEETIDGYSLISVPGNATLVNKRTPDERSVTVTKAWLDNFDQDGKRPLTIEVQLLADGEAVGEVTTLTPAGDWTYTWTGLPVNADGETITYTVAEISEPEGYTSIINAANASNILITNSHDPEMTTIEGTKTWDDAENQDGVRPTELKIYLSANGFEMASQIISGEGNVWNYSFTNLPVYRDGERITYTVTEETIDGYSLTSVTGNLNLVNTRTPDERTMTVTKAWLDNFDQDGMRPSSVKVQLLADGESVGEAVTLTAAMNWTHTWTGLPVNASGQAITYTIEEVSVPDGYTSVISATDASNIVVTNTHQPEVTSIEGTKTWDDANDQDGARPTELRVYLLANGFEMASQIISGEGNVWDYSFNELPVYRDGERITYTITEETVLGYTLTSRAGSPDLINTRTPDERSVTVTKAWLDSFDQDGLRPEAIEVQLLANGEIAGEAVTLTAATNWTYTWTGLPVNAEGQAITYTVAELTVPNGYTSTVNNYDANNLLITNSRQPEVISIEGTKTWNDANDQDGVRPTELRIYLLADGVEVATQVITGEGNVWDYSFANLPVFRAGERIVYTVTEATIEGYSLTSTAGAADLINTRTPDERSVTVTKAWLDGLDQDGLRPETIEVQLLANGEVVGEAVTLTAAMNWTHTWTGLPVNAAGETITYTVSEVEVPEGYISTINSTDASNIVVINSHQPEMITLNGEKVWVDNEDAFGYRPEAITVRLLQNGVAHATVEVTPDEAGNWDFSFDNLPKYFAQGELIDYRLEEVAVPRYVTEIEGTTITNTFINDETVTIAGQKVWNDYNDQFGHRPDMILVHLVQDGERIETLEVMPDSDGNWNYRFDEQLKFDETGREFTYTVEETEVPEYKTEIDGSTIINTYINTDTTALAGQKVWQDYENRFGTRPESITIHLLQNGQNIAEQVVTANAMGDWFYSFTDLAMYDETGAAFEYRIEEVAVEGYQTNYDASTIINEYVNEETVTIQGEKIWMDDDNQAKLRPETIVVILMRNGETLQEAEINGTSDQWTFSFENLPKYDAMGDEYVYEIDEVAVEGYTTTNKDGNIINTLIEQPKPKPDPDPKDRLPETGETSLNQYVLTVIALGFVLIALGRKRNREVD